MKCGADRTEEENARKMQTGYMEMMVSGNENGRGENEVWSRKIKKGSAELEKRETIKKVSVH